MEKKLSIIIFGDYTPKTFILIDNLNKIFNCTEFFLSTSSHINKKEIFKLTKQFNLKVIKYNKQPKFLDYGKKSFDFLNFFISICIPMKKVLKERVLIINSKFDLNNVKLNKIHLNKINLIKKKISYYDFKKNITQILIFTNSKSKFLELIFGEKNILKKIFYFDKNSYPNIFNTTIFPLNISLERDSYLTIEDMFKIMFIKKNLDKKKRKLSFDEIIGNFKMFDKKISDIVINL